MKQQAGAARPSKSRFGFIGETISELKKVTWPTKRETLHLSTMVVIVSVSVGLILWVIDYGFFRLVNNLLLGGS